MKRQIRNPKHEIRNKFSLIRILNLFRASNFGFRVSGTTLVELVIAIAVGAILAAAFSKPMVPLMNSLFFQPQSTRVNSSAQDAIESILEGDHKAKGLRFTGPPCTVGGGGGGGSTITSASATSLTYNYADSDYCGDGARTSHTVAVTYDATEHVVTRAIDGGAASVIPDYVQNASDINLDPPSGVNFFRYFNNEGTEMIGIGINALAIYRVDVSLVSASGSGVVTHNAGQTMLKSGVDIKRYTAPPTACLAPAAVCVADAECCSGSCVV